MINKHSYTGKTYEEAVKCNDLYVEGLKEKVEPINGAIEILEYLKEKDYEIVIATNGPSDALPAKLEKLGFTNLIDKTMAADECGYMKPNPRFYEALFDKINNHNKEEMLFIGDEIEKDIKDKIQEENIEGLEKGMDNLYRHISNIKDKFGLNVIVAINRFTSDTEAEIECLRKHLEEKGVELSLVEGWAKGGEGAIDIAQKLVNLTEKEENFQYMYELNEGIKEKIEKVATKIYGAKGVVFEEAAQKEIERIEKLGYANLPVCIAKTQYSFSDDPKDLLGDKPFNLHVTELKLKEGAEFIVVLTGKIMTMPGLPKKPAAENINIDENGVIEGIF